MPLASLLIALLLLGYLPGYATARLCLARSGIGLAPRRLSPFVEITFSLCLSSWSGFLLAECGAFSLETVLLVDGIYAAGLIAAAYLFPARGQRTAVPAGAWTPRTILAGLAIALVAGAFYFPPFDTTLMASDASFYLSAGVHLARHGSISIPDPLLAELDLQQRALLFPRVLSGGYARISGGLVLTSLDSEVVWPTFSHLFPLWVAVFYKLAGLQGCSLVATVFAVLSLWAIVLFTAEARGWWQALVAGILVMTNLGELWYARFPMPEILTQFFLWAGLLSFVLWWRHGLAPMAALCALSFGVASLTRIEYLGLLPLALGLFLALRAQYRRGLWLFCGLYGALVAHGLMHLVIVPTHYRDVIRSQAVLLWKRVQGLAAPGIVAALLVVVALLAAVVVLRRGRVALRLLQGATLAAAASYIVTFVQFSDLRTTSSVAWLADAVPWPLLGLAVVGLVMSVRESLHDEPALALLLVLFAVVGGQLLYDPHVMPAQFWVLRRFLPLVIPALYVFAVAPLHWVHRLASARRAGAALSLGLVAALVFLNARAPARIHGVPFYPEQKKKIRSLAEAIPADAVAFFTAEYRHILVHLPLWLVYDRESFLLPPWTLTDVLREVVPVLSRKHPVFYATSSPENLPDVAGIEFRLHEATWLRSVLPDFDSPRTTAEPVRGVAPLLLYEVHVTRS